MDPRLKIPALALLGLQLTDCKHEDSPLVGDWHAVELDDQAFPVEYNQAGYNLRYGFGLHVEADLAGHFLGYYVQERDDIGTREEYQLPLIADDDDPQFRLTISGPERSDSSEDYSYGASALPLLPLAGAALRAPTRDDLGAPLQPRALETFLILDCRLADDTLDCDKVGPAADADTPRHWRFVRDEEET